MVFIETSTALALEVPANLVPVLVALSPTGEPLAIELGGEAADRDVAFAAIASNRGA